MSKVIHVAVGVILGRDGRILIARRPDHLHMGGRWEFPGGKVEAGESVQEALTRELREEIAIDVEAIQPLTEIRHEYPEKTVLLDTWWVTAFSGEPRGLEGQETRWVARDELDHYQFPDANQAIIEAIQHSKVTG
ncbi:8-oxo-dGTP diphosphatase MutT [Microbulbifer flavimaris]|uniref:8-oxo-dGTP diphosphatase n=1 Tax=Microbulbifer flavimaris TaxID=1781068 RepID=A0ABX4I1F3_9GAMM|nr:MULTISPECIES: 8-oxo-dGTP diphosphatase MutT [Microbulbifer]KUJ84144.1 7,8-dihydro-8-oxoguanine-triphosphatase [Microbulbifer sp. ZGT114]PCO06217.1 8-oxo-dGTP diphosphatase MutT [Microbulbifer flavimaris]